VTEPLHDYAFIADGERGALVGPQGDIDWMCFPRWHSPAVFAGLVGGAGRFTVRPHQPCVSGGAYEDDSLIWKSRWLNGDGVVECRQALALPSSPDRVTMLRRICATRGDHRIQVTLEPAHDYGRVLAGRWSGRGAVRRWSAHGGDFVWRISSVAGARVKHGALELTLDLREGDTHDLVLELGDDLDAAVSADELWDSTVTTWRRALDAVPSAREIRHSFAILRGMTSSSGGTVAAATTSLPERADHGSYDYRYVWIRDLCYMGSATAVARCDAFATPAARFVTQRLLADGDQLSPAYTVDGDPVPAERHAGFTGYPGGGDVVGNDVRSQFQLDPFGEALHFFALCDELGVLDAAGWRAARVAAQAIADRWTEADAGIWELDARRWTHSRLACIAGLRAIAARPGAEHDSRDWLRVADQILADLSATVCREDGAWQRAPDDPRIDASLVLGGLRGATPMTDPRHRATVTAVERELGVDGYIYRFRPDEDRSLAATEGAFVLCNLWMSLDAAADDDRVKATRWFERALATAGPAGLFAEEFDVGQRELKGNLPQAFVHALVIEAAHAIAQRERESG
jgi:GH15 family glucan-1,4-alpha-glucosidase